MSRGQCFWKQRRTEVALFGPVSHTFSDPKHRWNQDRWVPGKTRRSPGLGGTVRGSQWLLVVGSDVVSIPLDMCHKGLQIGTGLDLHSHSC